MAAPNLSLYTIKQMVGIDAARAIVVIAVTEVVNYYNVGKTMSQEQVAITVDMIIERFGYFKIEDVKLAFRIGMYATRLYDRLDGSIMLEWIKDHDAHRDEYCSLRTRTNEIDATMDTSVLSYDEYWDSVRIRAESGNIESITLWENHVAMQNELSKKKILKTLKSKS